MNQEEILEEMQRRLMNDEVAEQLKSYGTVTLEGRVLDINAKY